MYQLCFYVPASHLETVKAAVFDAGAGAVGGYDRGCWQTRGETQFRPLLGSEPATGQVGTVTRVEEYKVEMVCDNAVVRGVIRALLAAHPYEQPAWQAWPLSDWRNTPEM